MESLNRPSMKSRLIELLAMFSATPYGRRVQYKDSDRTFDPKTKVNNALRKAMPKRSGPSTAQQKRLSKKRKNRNAYRKLCK